jgi:hypothetical protein
MEKELKMSKNRKFRDYAGYSQKEEVKEPVETRVMVEEEEKELEEVIDLVKKVRGEEQADGVTYDYTKKEEVNTHGLDANTFKTELPTGVIDTDRLRVRTSPEVRDDNIMGIYTKGTEVTILEDAGEWLTVEISKNSIVVRGFVMAKFIKR